jgi:1-acyl-sn-glycerol-3-phosphate acyltransferase
MAVIESASRSDIGAIVARESAETLAGSASGLRVAATRRLIRPAAHLVAKRFVDFDSALGDRGPVGGAEWIIARATGGVVAEGSEHVPASGGTLVVANHPGLADAVALLASMRRDDAWIVAADYPFLRAMRRASRRFLFVDDRCAAVRRIVRRLRAGDAVLLFPAGELEPDPANALDDAQASLASWSRSIELIARLAPRAAIVPAVVSGAVSRATYAHPLARHRVPTKERQRLASLLQLAFPAFQHQRVAVRFGAAIPARTGDLQAAVLASMSALMTEPERDRR